MEQTPQQAAIAEQAVRDAAFERARRKLASARSPEERARPGLAMRARLRQVALGLLVLVGCFLSWLQLRGEPQLADMSLWIENPDYPAKLLLLPLLLVVAVFLRFRVKGKDKSEQLIRGFYGHFASTNKPCGLADYVIGKDFDDAPRRAPPFGSYVQALPMISTASDLDFYWKIMSWYDGKMRYTMHVGKCTTTEIEPGLRLAQIELTVKRAVFMGSLWYIWPVMVPIFVIEKIEKSGGPSWSTKLGILAVWLWVVFAMFLLEKVPSRKIATLHVRKLVVQCGKDWRLLCGDWQGWEEADLSWLDAPATT